MVNGVNKLFVTYISTKRIFMLATRKTNLINRIEGGPQETRFLLVNRIEEGPQKKKKKL